MTQSRPRDSISGRNVDPGVAARNEPEIGASEAARGNSDLQKELAEVLRQRAAISEVLRAIASSPHDLQPIFDTILDSAASVPSRVGRLPSCRGSRLSSRCDQNESPVG